jgi:uncharacterized protein YbjT (DUF2867 family)
MVKNIRKVFVHGANGVQGGAIARRLSEEGFDVRAGVRNSVKSASLTAERIEVIATDLESVSALRHASQGADAMVLTLPLEQNRETVLRWTENAAQAARDGGVGLVVLNGSTRIPPEPSEVASFEIRRAAESVLRRAGVPSILLRPPLFMQNLAGPWVAGGIARDRVLAYPLPEGFRVSWLSVSDLGAYVAAALRRPDLAGRTLDIGGPEVLDGAALAREVSRAVGHPLRYVAIPPDVFEQNLAAHFAPAIARGIAQAYHFAAKHADTILYMDSDAGLTRELARPRVTVSAWARTQAWSAAMPAA